MTTLYDAMRFRLSRFLDDETPAVGEGNQARSRGRPCPEKTRAYLQQTAVVLTLEGERNIPIIDMVAARFQSEVREWVRVHVVDKRLHEPILEDVDFIVRRWPIKSLEARVRNDTRRMADGTFDPEWSLDGLSSEADEPLETYVTEDGLILAEWPKGGADLETVLRWWVARHAEEDDGSVFRRHLRFQLGLSMLDVLLTSRARRRGEPDPELLSSDLMRRPGHTLGTNVDERFSSLGNISGASLDIRTAAVVYLAEQRARRHVFAADAAQYTLDYFRELTDNASGAAERRHAAEDAICEEATSLVGDAHATDELSNELRVRLRVLREKAGFDTARDGKALAEEGLEDGILVFDARFATYIASLGPKGKDFAKQTRDNAEERMAAKLAGAPDGELWVLWTEKRFLLALARALWCDVVEPRIIEARKKPVALTRAVSSDLIDLYSRRYEPEARNGQRTLVFPDANRGYAIVPSIADAALSRFIEKGVDLLTSELGIDLLEWQVTQAHRNYIDGASDFRRIEIDGGWSGVAHSVGRSKKEAADQVKAIVLAQAHIRFDSFGIQGNLLSYTESRKAAPGQRARVAIVLGDMLLAGFTHSLRERHGSTALSSREGQRLVPILGKAALVGRPKDFAAQRRMVWRLAMALRDSAEEIAKTGAVTFPIDRWVTLGLEAGAPSSSSFMLRVREAWEKGDDKTPPLIVRNGDQVTLHESRRDALNFIVAGGKLSTQQRKNAKAAGRERQRKALKPPR